jgi:hypothetical protein
MVCLFSLTRVGVTNVVVGMAAEEVEARFTHPFVFVDFFPDREVG